MALSNRDRIGKALDQLLMHTPYISAQLYDQVGSDWQTACQLMQQPSGRIRLGLFGRWQDVFKRLLSQSDRAYVSELKEAETSGRIQNPCRQTMLTGISTRQCASAAISTPQSKLNRYVLYAKSCNSRSTPNESNRTATSFYCKRNRGRPEALAR